MAIDDWSARIEEEWLLAGKPRDIADNNPLPADELFAQYDDLGEEITAYDFDTTQLRR